MNFSIFKLGSILPIRDHQVWDVMSSCAFSSPCLHIISRLHIRSRQTNREQQACQLHVSRMFQHARQCKTPNIHAHTGRQSIRRGNGLSELVSSRRCLIPLYPRLFFFSKHTSPIGLLLQRCFPIKSDWNLIISCTTSMRSLRSPVHFKVMLEFTVNSWILVWK